jgi:excisionase family DNA binding protein
MERLLSPKEAAERAAVSLSLIYAWVAEGLPHFRLGKKGRRGHIRIAEADLDAFLVTMRREGRQGLPSPLPAPPVSKRPATRASAFRFLPPKRT